MDIATIEAELVDLADFEEVGSVARARKFVTAANRWLILTADTASSNSQSMTIGKNYVETMMKRATSYIAANQSASSRTRFLHVGSLFR